MGCMEATQTIPAPDANILLIPHFLTEREHSPLFQYLLDQPHWRQDDITIFGKTHKLPRLQAWYGDEACSYSYSGIILSPRPWSETLRQLKQEVETASNAEFNSVLLNLYRHGQDSNGWHSDDEPELGDSPTIASLSLGATRRFKLRHKFRKDQPAISLDLPAGSLLLMKSDTQKYWQHCIPKTAREVGPRINLTFRKVFHGQS